MREYSCVRFVDLFEKLMYCKGGNAWEEKRVVHGDEMLTLLNFLFLLFVSIYRLRIKFLQFFP